MPTLHWHPHPQKALCQLATIGSLDRGDGVTFELTHEPACCRRGPWRLEVDVIEGPGRWLWVPLDQHQGRVRCYLREDCAKMEAEAIAGVLLADRARCGSLRPPEGLPPQVPVPSDVLCWTDGTVTVLSLYGDRIPDLEGDHEDVKERVWQAADQDTKFGYGGRSLQDLTGLRMIEPAAWRALRDFPDRKPDRPTETK
jgi:hypothetical protein